MRWFRGQPWYFVPEIAKVIVIGLPIREFDEPGHVPRLGAVMVEQGLGRPGENLVLDRDLLPVDSCFLRRPRVDVPQSSYSSFPSAN